MKIINDKQSQRDVINEAVRDFLLNGGTIKKIDLRTASQKMESDHENLNLDDFLELCDPENTQLGSVRKNNQFGDN